MKVMMAGTTASTHHNNTSLAGKAKEAENDAAVAPGPSALRDVLYMPVNLNTDPALAHAELEKSRLHLAGQVDLVHAEERRLGAITQEYNTAHNIEPCAVDPMVLEEPRVTGRAVGNEIARAAQPVTF